jgi:hypothetical protein
VLAGALSGAWRRRLVAGNGVQSTPRAATHPSPCAPPAPPASSPRRGDVGQHREAHYSRGIRQKLRKMALKQQWLVTQNVSINEMATYTADYSESMSKSLFCVVAPGARRGPAAHEPVIARPAGSSPAPAPPGMLHDTHRTHQARPPPHQTQATAGPLAWRSLS